MSSWLRIESIPSAVLPFVYAASSVAMKLLAVSAAVRNRSLPSRAECVGHVTNIKIYPVKSMDGMETNEAECTFTGLKLCDEEVYDRRFLLTVGDDYRFVTARQCPTLLLVKTSVDNGSLCFDAPGMERLRVPLVHDVVEEQGILTKVWGQKVFGWDCGSKAADWFTRYLVRPYGKYPDERYRLLFNAGCGLRNIDRKPHLLVNDVKSNDKLVYHDDGPFLLTTNSSFNDLSRRLAENNVASGSDITMESFRPTITVDGATPPFDEDDWNEVFIGDAKFTRFMPCARCLLTTVDPKRGEIRKDGEPVKTLRSYRIIQPGSESPCFGIYLVCDRQAKINVGDAVYILRRRPTWP